MNRKTLQIGGWLIFVAFSLWIAARYWSTAFPVASVPFPLTRAEESARMESFLQGMGAPVAQYRSAIVFEENSEPKNFIERQYGTARLAEAAKSGVDIWYWEARWFKAEQHEEYRAWTDQNGNITGYSHIIEEERALPTLTQAQARALAEDFLRRHIGQHPFSELHYLEAASEQKPNRTDYTFTWEEASLRIGDAPYHLYVTVQGNEIGTYGEFLKVPEWWTVQYGRERAVNDLCYRTATFVSVGILLGLIILFLRGVRNHQVRWRDAAPWGWLVVMGLAGAATRINGIPETIFSYPTTEQWRPFVAGAIFSGVRSVMWEVILFWALMLVADCIYREWLPSKSSFRRALGPVALRDAQTVRALGVGIVFGVFALAYVCVFYTVGQRLGVWCPVDIDFSKTMSGPMPWVEALHTGLTASFTEEMIFRVGALLLFWRLIRVRWLAVLLAAASWGFLHSTYPQMPGYTRGIELTIAGVIWGSLLLRYGVVATLTAHYLYDCWLGSVIAFQGAGWENKAGAIVVSAWPVALFLWGAWRAGPALEPEETNVPATPDVPAPPRRVWGYEPLRIGRRGIALVLLGCVAGLAAVVFLPRPQHKIEELGKLDLSREAIIRKADAALREHGYSPDGYQRVASVQPRAVLASYLLEHGSLDRLASLWNREWPELTWTVRYFRFLQPEEFTVSLDEHGNFLTWYHTVLREAPGAELDEAAAMARARDALARDGRIDLSRQELIAESPTQQEHRRDWIFGFDQKNFGWGDAKLRTYIRLQGNEAVNLYRYVKVPDAWILEHAKRGWKQFVSGELKHWMDMAEDGLLAILMILAIQKHVMPWRKAFLYGLFPLALKLVDVLNQLPQFYAGYQTTVPRGQYLFTQLGTSLVSAVVAYLGGVFVIAVALGFLRWAWGWTPDQWAQWPVDPQERRRCWGETLLIVFASVVAFWVLDLVDAEMRGHFWPAEVVAIRYWSITEWAPWIGGLTEALTKTYGEMIRVAITSSVLLLIWRRHPRIARGLLLLMPLLDLPKPETLGGFVWWLVYSEAGILLMAWLVLKVWRFNAVAIFLTYWVTEMCAAISLFLRKGGAAYRWEAAPLIALILVVLVAIWWSGKESVQPASPETQ